MISVLISLAALAERCASSRTSWATTAKPLPASPARAASTPAFSASRLVWKAISSIIPMMLPIFREDSSMASIAETASRTTAPDFSAEALVRETSAPASSARLADSLTDAVTSSTAAAVSSTEAACCSVRRDRSSAAVRISSDALRIADVFSPTRCIADWSFSIELLKSSRSWSRDGMKGCVMRCSRSPSARCCRPAPI